MLPAPMQHRESDNIPSMKTALITFGVLSVVAVGAWYIAVGGGVPVKDEGVVCTADAMQCADGSWVGRSGPNCEFVCPTSSGGTGSVGEFWGTVLGSVLLGPSCPVVQDPPDPKCDDKPYKTRLALTTVDGARVIQEFESDAAGKFRADVPPGRYMIRSAAAANVLPYCQSAPFTVPVNDFVEVLVSCDTGIR